MKQKTMTANKEENVPKSLQSSSLIECCMCGDSGLTHELFQCKVCQFRYEHRYCSNLYPKAESYKVCNWCLNQKVDSKQKSQNSSNSSASRKDNSQDDSKNKKNKGDNHGVSGIKGSQRNNNSKLQLMKYPIIINKPKSPEKPPRSTRKRITTNARLQQKFRTTKSEEISNGGHITKHVFRNKVRRYKLLDEVSS